MYFNRASGIGYRNDSSRDGVVAPRDAVINQIGAKESFIAKETVD